MGLVQLHLHNTHDFQSVILGRAIATDSIRRGFLVLIT
jgi:hypothetical protein